MQLDPQVQEFVDEFNTAAAESDAQSLWDRPIADVRANMAKLWVQFP